jgi:hypothetical protein
MFLYLILEKLKINTKKVLIDNGIEWEEEGHTEDLISMQCSHEKS